MRLHEDFQRKSGETQSSERSFGVVFAGVCAFLGIARLYHGSPHWILWFVGSLVFMLLAYFWTAPLKPLNLIWHRFGLLLFKVTNPVIMGIIYYGSIVPTGIILQLMKKDILNLNKTQAVSYWVERVPSGPRGQDMKNQF